MDPNENLQELLDRAREITRVYDDCFADGTLTPDQAEFVAIEAERVAELVVALDEWLRKGGFLPAAWTGAR